MIFDIETKDEAGKVVFSGTLNKNEATFVMNVGINYLMAKGAMDMIKRDEGDGLAHPAPSQAQ